MTLATTIGQDDPETLPHGRLARAIRRHHAVCLTVFAIIVIAHWAEHLVQAFQIYAMDWPMAEARGVIGLWFPWLIKSELLHYAYAIVMLTMLWMLRDGFSGAARQWWMLAFGTTSSTSSCSSR